MRRGIGAVTATASPHFSIEADKISYASNSCYYRAEVGL
jgi:hypothetical protein